MESSRRLAIAATLGVVVIALAAGSDFLYSSFWSSHAMVTSLLASLLVLAVTIVVLNEVIDRRDRRAAGMTAPAHGLVLQEVFYPKAKPRRP